MQVLLACAAVACSILSIVACDSRDSMPSGPSPNRLPPADPSTLSGQVFNVTAGTRVAAADVPVLGVFLSGRPGGGGWWSATYRNTTTGSDGRYQFPYVPATVAIVRTHSAAHRQICGAIADLNGATQLDVEVTSSVTRQPSPTTLTPLKVTGQIYEMTPAGRLGIDGAEIYTIWANDGPFIGFYAGPDGRYTACGIPANWPIGYEIYKTGYTGAFVWRQFSGDSVLDFELERQ